MIFDVESDGLLDKATKIHCMAYTDGDKVKSTTDYFEMRSILSNAKLLIGHNIVLFDVPLVEKLLGIKITARLIDTLALSWTLHPNRHIYGLDSYGTDAGIPKPKIDDWENLSSEEYIHRCEEDVKINKWLWKQLREKLLSLYNIKEDADRYISYIMFKMDCAREQAISGWKLNVELATNSHETLLIQQDEKIAQLKEVMPKIPVFVTKTRPVKPFKKDGTYGVHGALWFSLLKENNLPDDYRGEVKVPTRYIEPNPNSPDQVKQWLFSMGWQPATFKYIKTGGEDRVVPQVRKDVDGSKELCHSVIDLIEDNPVVEVLEGLSVIQHRLSIFSGFLENHKDGWLVADIGGLTNTLRFKHRVLVNLPGVDKAWGEEIRGCLIVPDGHIMCGSDVISLEETTKKHYMFQYDPDYVMEMSQEGFDAHLDLAKFAGVCNQEQIDAYVGKEIDAPDLKPIRKKYKAANYSCVYGVGGPSLARTVGISVKEAKGLIEAYWKRNWAVKEVSANQVIKNVDGEMWLLNPVSGFYYSLRNEKDIFSTLNQGTGVYCFDMWIKEVRSKRKQLTGQFHDEIIACLKTGQESRYEKLLKDSMETVNTNLKLNIPLGVDVKFGMTYAEVH